MDDLTWWNRVVEGSPLIVLLLIGAILALANFGWRIISRLIARLDAKDEQVLKLHEQTIIAVRDNTEAVRELKHAIDRNEHRR